MKKAYIFTTQKTGKHWWNPKYKDIAESVEILGKTKHKLYSRYGYGGSISIENKFLVIKKGNGEIDTVWESELYR